MKFSIAAVVGVLAAVGLAKPSITNTEFDVEEGKPFTLTWVDAKGPVTVTLVEGPPPNGMVPVKDLASGLTGTSFTFTPTGLPSGTYAFRIKDTSDPDPNFSLPFVYVGTGSSSSSTRVTSSSASSTSAQTSSSRSASETSSTSSASNRSTTTASTTRTTQTTVPTGNLNEGQRFSSPLALVFLTVAALVFFN